NMRSSWIFLIHMLWLKAHQCAPTKKEMNLQENLKMLSEIGEKYVDEEVKKALTGIKQMQIMMERNGDKHVDLMKTLKRTDQEKKEALQLMDEVKERLEEEERQCQVSLKNVWNECESCLESNCMRFYTTCRASLSTIVNKVEDFFRKISPVIFSFYEDQGKDLQSNEKNEKEDTQLVKMEDIFSQLASDMGTLFDKSFVFFKQMQTEFDQSFQTYFMSDVNLTESHNVPALPEDSKKNSSFHKNWDMSGFLQVVFDFGKTVFEGVSKVITKAFDGNSDNNAELPEQAKDADENGMFSMTATGREGTLCKDFPQNSAGCSQFHERCQKCQDMLMKDCPNIPELHAKLDEALKLVNISSEQYEQILQLIQHHTEDTSYLLNKMKERFGWVSELSNVTIRSENIFNIVKMSPGDSSSPNETVVDVNILTSPTFTIKVPHDLDTESSEFIEYIAGKALQLYKQNF
uniref:Clusterin n=2 Tax=Crocodylus porosus TaxID=8502 RepID=A0A7M4F212_CROPO